MVVNPGWVQTDMGGANATLSPAESVTALRGLIETLGPAQSGKFFNYNGREYAWRAGLVCFVPIADIGFAQAAPNILHASASMSPPGLERSWRRMDG